MKNRREINGKKKKKNRPQKVRAGDMSDKGDKEATAPTRHARPIKIKQRRRTKDHQSTQQNRTILPFLYLLRGMVYDEESYWNKIRTRPLLLERVKLKITLKQGTTQNRS